MLIVGLICQLADVSVFISDRPRNTTVTEIEPWPRPLLPYVSHHRDNNTLPVPSANSFHNLHQSI